MESGRSLAPEPAPMMDGADEIAPAPGHVADVSVPYTGFNMMHSASGYVPRGQGVAALLMVCPFLLLLTGCSAMSKPGSLTMPTQAVDAAALIGRPDAVVEMTVRKSKDRIEKRGVIYLDSEDDFKAATNLGVAITALGAARFREAGVADPAGYFLGKTIRVRGCVMRFEERLYLPVDDPRQISVVEQP